MESSGTNSKFQKNRPRTTLKTQAKNNFLFSCIPMFKKIVSFYSHIFKICNYKKGIMRHISIITHFRCFLR